MKATLYSGQIEMIITETEQLYSGQIEKIITETDQAGLIESTGMKIQEIFIQTDDSCLVKTLKRIQ